MDNRMFTSQLFIRLLGKALGETSAPAATINSTGCTLRMAATTELV
jgi:hypothetical protein